MQTTAVEQSHENHLRKCFLLLLARRIHIAGAGKSDNFSERAQHSSDRRVSR
jgi:hypothetical protein